MNIDNFVMKFLQRSESLFLNDINNHKNQLFSEIENKKILVIGGAGTIGNSFIKALLKFRPANLVVVDINENGLTELVRDLRSTNNQYIPKSFYTYPFSFDSPIFIKLIKSHGQFDIVANFAAHKHVRSEKDIFSIHALLDNNLVKAKNLLDLLVEFPPKHFFCVSTDKAANPVNIMGASKKMMEDLILSYSNYFKISTARFANVAFSNGSLLEGFLKRIEKHQPLSCPNDVTRFFVSPQESGEICLLACILGKTSEIFFPKIDMIKGLVNFVDIFPALLTELGYEAYECNSDEEARNSMYLLNQGKYPVYLFKTDTTGEKLYEEFYTKDEKIELNRYNSLGVISKECLYTKEQFSEIINNLSFLLSLPNTNKEDIVSWMSQYVSEFNHIETGFNLDNKM